MNKKQQLRILRQENRLCAYCHRPMPINIRYRKYCSELCATRGRALKDHIRFERNKDRIKGYDKHGELGIVKVSSEEEKIKSRYLVNE